MDDGGQAFPSGKVIKDLKGEMPMVEFDTVEGMSLRDWFAGQALAGMKTNISETDSTYGNRYRNAELKKIVSNASEIADAMIAERKKNA